MILAQPRGWGVVPRGCILFQESGLLLAQRHGPGAWNAENRFELADDVAHVGIAVFGPLRRHFPDDSRERAGNGFDPFLGEDDRLNALVLEDFDGRSPFECGAAGQEEVERAAERVDIGTTSNRSGIGGELGPGVSRSADRDARCCGLIRGGGRGRRPLGERGLLGCIGFRRLGEPEVDHRDETLAVDVDNLGAQVAMEHVLVVRALEPACGLKHVADRFPEIKPLVFANQGSQRLAVDEFRDEVDEPLVFAEVVDRREMMLRELGSRIRFAGESCDEGRIARPLRLHHLEGHITLKRELAGKVDRPECPACELATDKAAAEECGEGSGSSRGRQVGFPCHRSANNGSCAAYHGVVRVSARPGSGSAIGPAASRMAGRSVNDIR